MAPSPILLARRLEGARSASRRQAKAEAALSSAGGERRPRRSPRRRQPPDQLVPHLDEHGVVARSGRVLDSRLARESCRSVDAQEAAPRPHLPPPRRPRRWRRATAAAVREDVNHPNSSCHTSMNTVLWHEVVGSSPAVWRAVAVQRSGGGRSPRHHLGVEEQESCSTTTPAATPTTTRRRATAAAVPEETSLTRPVRATPR